MTIYFYTMYNQHPNHHHDIIQDDDPRVKLIEKLLVQNHFKIHRNFVGSYIYDIPRRNNSINELRVLDLLSYVLNNDCINHCFVGSHKDFKKYCQRIRFFCRKHQLKNKFKEINKNE